MHGFDSETRKQMQGIHPQAVIQSSEPLDVEKLTAVLHAEFPAISAMTPTSSAFGLAQPESDERANPTVVMITAIESTTAPQVTAIEKILDDKTLSVITRPIRSLSVHHLPKRLILPLVIHSIFYMPLISNHAIINFFFIRTRRNRWWHYQNRL